MNKAMDTRFNGEPIFPVKSIPVWQWYWGEWEAIVKFLERDTGFLNQSGSSWDILKQMNLRNIFGVGGESRNNA